MGMLEQMSFDKPPIMFAAWPGMGNVGLMAIEYLRKSLDANLFAELDLTPFYVPEEVVVENGMAHFPEIPRSFFHEQHDPDLVFFESTLSASGKEAMSIAQTVLDVAKKLKAPRIYTAAAFPQPMSHTAEPVVYAASNTKNLLHELRSYGVEPMPAGMISGLSGLVLGIAASRHIEAACLVATIPSYAAGLNYPKGSLAIVKTFSRILDISIDTNDLERDVDESELEFEDVEERLRNLFPSLLEQDEKENSEEREQWEPPSEPDDKRVPEYVMERIEQLFRSVKKNKDKDRAKELKAELDKWGLYKVYENRFLDIFKDGDELE